MFHLTKNKKIAYLKTLRKKLVGSAGFEPTTFTQDDAKSVFAGFSKTAPEIRHPFRSANPLSCFLEPAVLAWLDYGPTLFSHKYKRNYKKALARPSVAILFEFQDTKAGLFPNNT